MESLHWFCVIWRATSWLHSPETKLFSQWAFGHNVIYDTDLFEEIYQFLTMKHSWRQFNFRCSSMSCVIFQVCRPLVVLGRLLSAHGLHSTYANSACWLDSAGSAQWLKLGILSTLWLVSCQRFNGENHHVSAALSKWAKHSNGTYKILSSIFTNWMFDRKYFK